MANGKLSNSSISGGFGECYTRHMREHTFERVCLATGMVYYDITLVCRTSMPLEWVKETLFVDGTECEVKSYRQTTLSRFTVTHGSWDIPEII
jgi:hypothetical protein